MKDLAKFSRRLRAHGFLREFDSIAGGGRIIQFIRPGRWFERTLKVQLWSDGEHRVSHEFNGCADTSPTGFRTLAEMDKAIEHETSRADSDYRPGGTKGSWNREAAGS